MEERKLERRLEELGAEVARLGERVAQLEAAWRQAAVDTSAPVPPHVEAPAEVAPGVGSAWGATSTVLSRTAVVCFLLVVALALRTLTDAGLLAPAPGAGVGVAYAAALMAAAGVIQRRRRALAAVVAVCGSLLLCAVVIEARKRLGVLPEPAAYGLLAGAAGALALLGRRGAPAPACVGVPALLAAGLLLGVSYPGLGGVVLGATAAALSVGRHPRCGWLPWLVVAATAALWVGWAGRVGGVAAGDLGGQAVSEAAWYLTALVLFVVLHLVAAFRGAWTSAPGRPGVLDAVAPAVTVGWAFPALVALGRDSLWPAGVGALGAGMLLLLAWAGARRHPPGAVRVAAFANAAGLLGLVVAASRTPWPPAALLLAAGGLSLAFLAQRWESGGTRAGSYALQGSAAVWAAASGAFAAGQSSPGSASAIAAGAAVLAFLHYRRCRSLPVPGPSWFFERLDRTDDTAVVVLLASLGLAFLAVRTAVYPGLVAWGGDVGRTFQGAQSVIVHLSALTLAVAAFLRRDAEMRAVALLVTGVGAVKTFLYDLLTLQGLPLLASVLAFGAAAAMIAVLLRRWPSQPGVEAGSP